MENENCDHDYVRPDGICAECGIGITCPNCRKFLDSSAEIKIISSDSSAKFVGDFLSLPIDEETDKARLELMFSMHREFMRRYEDLVQDRDHWQALAESKK